MTTLKLLPNHVIDRCHKIILLVGVRGSGKDFFARKLGYIYQQSYVEHLKFAQPIREEFARRTGFNLIDDRVYEEWKQDSANRAALVEYSFNTKREQGQYYFANKIVEQIERLAEISIFKKQRLVLIVSDVRFLYEYQALASPKTEVIFCNYKSFRYDVARGDNAEALAIHLLDKYNPKEGADITDIMDELLKNGYKDKQ